MLPGKKYTARDFFEILRRRSWLFVVPAVVGLFAALIYSSTLPDRYQAEMLIAIVEQQVPDAFVRSTVALTSEDQLNAISVQIRSRALLSRLVEEFDLYPEALAPQSLENVIPLMNADILVEPEQQRRGPRGLEPPTAFRVKFTYTDPEIAARVTQRIGTLFVSQNLQDRGTVARTTNDFLQAQLEKARQQLEAQESRLEAFRARNGQALPTQMQTNLQAIQSTQLQIQALVESIARDRDRKLLLERLYREASREPALVEPAFGQSAEANATLSPSAPAAQQLAVAQSALAALQQRLEPEHPDVIRAKRRVADLEVKAAAEQADPPTEALPSTPAEAERRERLRQMAAEIESLERQTRFKESEEARFRATVAQYQRRIEAVPGVESEWAVLTRDYDTLQLAYRELLNKAEASKLAIDLERRQMGDQFRIVDNARVPVTPIGPPRLQINAIGLAIGLFLGIALTAMLEFRDSSFRSEADVYEALSLPVIGIVPYVQTARARAREQRTRLWITAVAVLATGGAGYVFWALQLWKSLA